MSGDESHVLVDAYLKKPWYVRLSSIAFKGLLLMVFLSGILYYWWRIMPPAEQASLRTDYPLIERTAAFLESQNLAPSTNEQLAALEMPPPAPEPRPEEPVYDLTDRTLVPEKKPVDNKLKQIPVRERAYEIAEEDEEGNIRVKRVTESELEEIAKRLEMEEKIGATRVTKRRTETKTRQEKIYTLREPDADGNMTIRRISEDEYRVRKKVLEVDKKVAERQRTERIEEINRLLTEGGSAISWKVWDDADPVTWDDFKNIEPDQEKTRWGAYIASGISVSHNGRAFNFFAYMVPENSWCRPGLRTEASLRHERLHFDITEMFARRMRAMVTQVPASDVNEQIKKVFEEWRRAQASYDNETNHSRNADMQKRWEAEIAKALNDTRGWKWVPKPKKLALQKYDEGYFLLGQVYDLGGKGFDKSPRLARKWYNLAINQGVPEAMNNMGALLLKNADGDTGKQKKAYKLFRRAAKKGTPAAQFNLGVAYWRGLGVKPDKEQALRWFTEAADRNPYARHALKILENDER